jgi:hypothetical protein
MGSKGSKHHHKQGEITTQAAHVTTATKQVPVTTTSTQAALITGGTSMPGIMTTVPATNIPVTTTSEVIHSTNYDATETYTSPTNFNR